MRRRRPEEHENHERWLVSYADFITLLFAFFVVMYAISSVNEGKYRVLSESLVAAFRAPTKSLLPIQVGTVAKSPYEQQIDFRQSPVAVELPNLPLSRREGAEGEGIAAVRPPLAAARRGHEAEERPWQEQMAEAQQMLETISAEIEQAMAEMIDRGLITVRRSRHWVEVEINSSILFPSGSATLSAGARGILEELAGILKDFPNAIHVEGFTDSVPINNVIFPSNWELSAGRAASVVHLLTEAGVAPQRLVAIAYGEYRPVAANDDPEGRAMNRRVVLVVQSTADATALAKALAEYERLRAPAASGDEAPAATPGPGDAPAQAAEVQRPLNPGARREADQSAAVVAPVALPHLPEAEARP